MSFRSRFGIFALAALSACSATAPNQSPPLSPSSSNTAVHPRRADSAIVPGVAPLTSDSVPPGVLRGVVADDSTGQAINGAQIVLGRDPHRRGAITDHLGRFSVPFDDRTAGLIHVQRIGYATRDDSVRLLPARGYAVVITLRPQAVVIDDFIVCPTKRSVNETPHDVISSMVRVRDALTGLAPASATLITVDGSYRDSSTTDSPAPDAALWLSGAPNRLGPFTLIVRSAGYYEWRIDRVRGVVNACGTLAKPRTLFAWLVPK